MNIQKAIPYPTDPNAYTGFKRPTNLFPEPIEKGKQYRRESWEPEQAIRLDGMELVLTSTGTRYFPTPSDLDASDWVSSDWSPAPLQGAFGTMPEGFVP